MNLDKLNKLEEDLLDLLKEVRELREFIYGGDSCKSRTLTEEEVSAIFEEYDKKDD